MSISTLTHGFPCICTLVVVAAPFAEFARVLAKFYPTPRFLSLTLLWLPFLRLSLFAISQSEWDCGLELRKRLDAIQRTYRSPENAAGMSEVLIRMVQDVVAQGLLRAAGRVNRTTFTPFTPFTGW